MKRDVIEELLNLATPGTAFANDLAEWKKKAHCDCESRAIHAHCRDCNGMLPEGEWQCETCRAAEKDRDRRTRHCRMCVARFLLTDSPPAYHARGLCSEDCYMRYLERCMAEAGVPEKFYRATFDGFEACTSSLKRARLVVREWAEGDGRVGLFLVGRAGCGKTHLAAAVLRAKLLRDLDRMDRFVNARKFILSCQSVFTHDKTAEDVIQELLKYCRLLVLDDLGSEKSTEYVRQCLVHLVDEVYTRGVRLLVTSNVEPERLAAVDPRISSRLAELCDVVKLEAPDYRIRIAHQRSGEKRIAAGGRGGRGAKSLGVRPTRPIASRARVTAK